MGKKLYSGIIFFIMFVLIMWVGASENNTVVNLETEEGAEYMFISMVSVICAAGATYCYKTGHSKVLLLCLLGIWCPPLLFCGIATFSVAAVFGTVVLMTTGDAVVDWFKIITEPDENEEDE